MIENITLGQIAMALGFILAIGGSIASIIKFVTAPMHKIQNQLSEIKSTVDRLDRSFKDMTYKQSKMGKDVHMSMVISKYLLDCETDTSDKGKRIRDEFNDYILNAATDQGDDADA